MEPNYVDEFAAKYVAVMKRTVSKSDYGEENSRYKIMLNSYTTLMSSIDTTCDINIIVKNLQSFNNAISGINQKLSEAWPKVILGEPYPKQSSIHGINIIVCKILDEINRCGSRKAVIE